jgi:hypothetical protein
MTGITLILITLLAFSPFVSVGHTEVIGKGETPLDYPWAFSLYGGVHASGYLNDVITFDADYSDGNNVLVAALTREIYRYKHYFSVEIEGQIGRHFGDDVSHWEIVGLGIGRWHSFPWDNLVDTSLAIGAGLSNYTDISYLEKDRDDEAQRLRGYLAFELTFGLPRYPRWDLMVRIHHRSNMWGVFGEGDSSNYVCVGLKYAF